MTPMIRTIPIMRIELADIITDAARISVHASFTEQVLARLHALPADMIGEGLVHRICVEEQRHFRKPIVVGARTKYVWSR